MANAGAILQDHVRRVAVLRAAQRALHDLVAREPLERSVAEGQVLFDQLRSLNVDSERGVELLSELETRLGALTADLVELASEVPLRALCQAARQLVPREPAAVRALGTLLLEGDVAAPATLRGIEALVTALACEEDPDGQRQVVRAPLEAFPELGRVGLPEIHEPHPDVALAEQVLGREMRRFDELDYEAVRERVARFKSGLGARVLHPAVLAASVEYNVLLGNRMLERAAAVDENVTADQVPGPEAICPDARADGEAPGSPAARSALLVVPETPARSRLLWQTASIVGIAAACLALAAVLWSRRIDVVEPAVASAVSPYLVSGYVSEDDGVARFVGTLDGDWGALDGPGRRLVLARIASRLAAEQVDSIVLVDATGSLQARQEGERLHWVSE